ncbi:cation:proton antiporter family protein [Ferrimonas senticii]|uniref:cation:proton antiporter family protein n=1 Tax=Ferrimonas senticii TaxID=394566 RepID=UPI000417DEBD|nr:cation:proton antiporter family protein [Ferrimonas senticii]
MDPLTITIPLLAALLISAIGLPPLIGYLIAGFILFAIGIDQLQLLQQSADLGVMLLLFAIGLKLDLRSLLKVEVWGVASGHMALTIMAMMALFKLLALSGIGMVGELATEQALVMCFALSFSSTVFAIKVLEQSGDTQSLYGRTAIGILIMQDLFAVLYLTASKGALPSPWALALLALIAARPLFVWLLDRCGHGEMLLLFGLTMTLMPGAALFELVGLKPDLGALAMGMLLAGSSKSSELAKSLFLFKELLLVAFFLSIGLKGIPTWAEVETAIALMLVLPLKFALFAGLLLLARFRLRSAVMSAMSLANFSEFGLIVMAAAIASGSLDDSWLRIIALSVTLSFVLAAPLIRLAHPIYQLLHRLLPNLERQRLHQEDQPIEIGHPKILIFGMGRIGSGAYDGLKEQYGDVVLGIDHKADIVERHHQEGRNAIIGDGTDSDFWAKLVPSDSIELIVLAMPSHQGNLSTAELIAESRYQGKVSAIVRYEDETTALMETGVHNVYNIYQAAGTGLADNIIETLPPDLDRLRSM